MKAKDIYFTILMLKCAFFNFAGEKSIIKYEPYFLLKIRQNHRKISYPIYLPKNNKNGCICNQIKC